MINCEVLYHQKSKIRLSIVDTIAVELILTADEIEELENKLLTMQIELRKHRTKNYKENIGE